MEAVPLGFAVVSLSFQVLLAVQNLHSFLAKATNSEKTFEELVLETKKLTEHLHQMNPTCGDGGIEHRKLEVDEALQTSMKLCETTLRALRISSVRLRGRKKYMGQDLMARSEFMMLPLEKQYCAYCTHRENVPPIRQETLGVNACFDDTKEHAGHTCHGQVDTRENGDVTSGSDSCTPDKWPLEKELLESVVKTKFNQEMKWYPCKAKTFPLDRYSNSNSKLPSPWMLHRDPPPQSLFAIIRDAARYRRVRMSVGREHIKRGVKYIANIAAEGVVGGTLCASALVMSGYNSSSHSGPSPQMLELSRAISKLKSVIHLGLDSSDDWMVFNRHCTSPRLIQAPQLRADMYTSHDDLPNDCSFNASQIVLAAAETGPCSPRKQLPGFLWELSSTTFFDAAMLFWIASMAFYLLHHRDRNQSTFVLTGVIFGSVPGFVLSWVRRDIGYLTRYLTWALVFSLFASALAHKVEQRVQVPAEKEAPEYPAKREETVQPPQPSCDVCHDLVVEHPNY